MNDSMNTRWLRWSLTAIATFLAIIAIELSVLIGPLEPQAYAQIPDSGLQRKQLLDEQKKTSRTLGNILQHLKTQSIKVKVVGTDKEARSVSTKKPRAGKR